MPNLTHTPDSFEACERVFETARNKARGKPLCGGGHITVQSRGDNAFAIQMHRTDVVTYHRDGRIVLRPWDSCTTHSVMRQLGFIAWRSSRIKFRTQHRIGSWHSNDGNGWPFDDEITIDADGYARGLYDRIYRVRKDRLAPRRQMLRDFRKLMLPRMLLGQWGDIFVEYGERSIGHFGRDDQEGLFSMVPALFDAQNRQFHALLMADPDSEQVARIFREAKRYRKSLCPNHAAAVRDVCDEMARWGFAPDDSALVRIDYPPVVLR